MKTPLVSIVTLAYNHEEYISLAIDSFLMQKTTFSFEIVIHDDASTDQTQNIIKVYEKKYPELIKPIYQKENQKSKGGGIVTRTAFSAAKGKYIALCEGDDYWTDPLKLQKQVEFLERNADYSMIHTDANVFNVSIGKTIKDYYKTKSIIHEFPVSHADILLHKHRVFTCTVLIRKEIIDKCSKDVGFIYPFGDTRLWVEASVHGKIKFLSDTTATRCYLEESASRSKNSKKLLDFSILGLEAANYIINRYPLSEKQRKLLFLQAFKTIIKRGFLADERDVVQEYYQKMVLSGWKPGLKQIIYFFVSKDKTATKILLGLIKFYRFARYGAK